MKREEIIVLAEALTKMKEFVSQLENAKKHQEFQEIVRLKKEILAAQKKIDEIL